jgi:hypothetical protein
MEVLGSTGVLEFELAGSQAQYAVILAVDGIEDDEPKLILS